MDDSGIRAIVGIGTGIILVSLGFLISMWLVIKKKLGMENGFYIFNILWNLGWLAVIILLIIFVPDVLR